MSKKTSKDIHPRSTTGRLNRLWQTKHGELCQALHDVRTSRDIVEGDWAPPYLSKLAQEKLDELYPVIGRLVVEAGPAAFRECWKKSESMMEMLKGKSTQARVYDAVETAWLAMSPMFLELKKDGTAVMHPKVPDFHKSGLKQRVRTDLERDPQMKRILQEPQGEEVFDKSFRRALKDLRLDNLPKAKSGPAPVAKKKSRR